MQNFGLEGSRKKSLVKWYAVSLKCSNTTKLIHFYKKYRHYLWIEANKCESM